MKDALMACMTQPFVTAQDVQSRIRAVTGIRVSLSTVYRALHACGLRYKKAYTQVQYSHVPQALQLFFQRWARAYASGTLVSVEEMGMQVGCRPQRGWGREGDRVVSQSSRMRHAKLSVAMAVSASRVCAMQAQQHNFNTQGFAAFVSSIDAPAGTTILMDNVSFHKAKPVLEALRAKGFEALYTPPYSPATNPIEYVFGVVKSAARKANQGTEGMHALVQAVTQATGNVGESLLAPCFARVGRMLARCAQGEAQFAGYDMGGTST
jgi:transposase